MKKDHKKNLSAKKEIQKRRKKGMLVRIINKKIEGQISWVLLLTEKDKRMFYHAPNYEDALKTYEKLTGKKMSENELLNLQIG